MGWCHHGLIRLSWLRLRRLLPAQGHQCTVCRLKIIRAIGADKQQRIGILGLSFKPGSDDVRDTPSAKIIQALLDAGYSNICGYDPVAIDEFRSHYPLPIDYVADYDGILRESQALVITTAWPEFSDVRSRTDKPVIDCRYML